MKRAEKTAARIEMIKQVYEAGMSAQDIADAVSARTREHLSRMVIMGLYTRNRAELAAYPLRASGKGDDRARRERENTAKRERRRLDRIARQTAPRSPAKQKERKAPTLSEAQIYDATATLKRLFELGTHECRWPISGDKSDILFCGHHAEGSYCAHHYERSVGKGTISERNAPSDLRRLAA